MNTLKLFTFISIMIIIYLVRWRDMNILKKLFSIIVMSLVTLLTVISGGYRESPELINEMYREIKK